MIGGPEGHGKKNSLIKATPTSDPYGPEGKSLNVSNLEEHPSSQEDLDQDTNIPSESYLLYDLMYGNNTSVKRYKKSEVDTTQKHRLEEMRSQKQAQPLLEG